MVREWKRGGAPSNTRLGFHTRAGIRSESIRKQRKAVGYRQAEVFVEYEGKGGGKCSRD